MVHKSKTKYFIVVLIMIMFILMTLSSNTLSYKSDGTDNEITLLFQTPIAHLDTNNIISFDIIMTIDVYIETILIPRFEGGYTSDDAGTGECKYGINKKYNPVVNIKKLTLEQAKQIYIEKYWKANNLDEVRSNKLAICIFDFTVNAGYNAIIELQELLCSSGFKVKRDGRIKRETLDAIHDYMFKYGESKLLREYSWKRRVYYRNLKLSSKYGRNWLRRVRTLNNILKIV